MGPPIIIPIVLLLVAASIGYARANCGPPFEAARQRPVLVAQLTPVGHAQNAVGTLIVKRADGRVDQLRGRGSLPLYEGDECRTERGGKAFIQLADGTQVALNEGTTFVLRGRMERGGGVLRVFRLLIGEMWMKTPGPQALEVEAPAATAAVRGTEFNIRVLPDGKSILTVIEGMVEFRNEFCSPCSAAKATQSVAERGRRCTDPVPADAARAAAWIADVVR
jgi:ferric-dicitrate binding protein FerR (iron transport regulator)